MITAATARQFAISVKKGKELYTYMGSICIQEMTKSFKSIHAMWINRTLM